MTLDAPTLLPLIFAALMALSFCVYAILDGFDLGVGLVLPLGDEDERNMMLASIGPFWDANETWLVLGVGLLLIAFPTAHGQILGALYLPVAVLLIGLILRGVAFDFRAKAPVRHKQLWDNLFFVGSLLATASQGYMLGRYVLAFESTPLAEGFAVLSALCVTSAYAFIGNAWLVLKTEGKLQQRSVFWASRALWLTATGIVAVSVVNPMVSPVIFERWFALPEAIALMPIPLMCGGAMFAAGYYLHSFERRDRRWDALPFLAAMLVFFLSFLGLAYSFYPDIVPGQLTVWEAAAATESLAFMGVGVAIVFPAIMGYTLLSYRVFWGKAEALVYH
jgi:cytochrome d ubiquinol oxidase subunit II